MKILKCVAILPLAFCLITPAKAAKIDLVCPTASEIDIKVESGGPVYPWVRLNPPKNSFNVGMGGKTVGSLLKTIPGTDTVLCLYKSDAVISPKDFAKKMEQVPVKYRPYLKGETWGGFILTTLICK